VLIAKRTEILTEMTERI